MGDPGQGIVHVIGPEQGRTLPGMTIVCGDSHTSTHGAFGALAFGIGTSEVEHVLATQTLPQQRAKTLAITVDGDAACRVDREGHHPRHPRSHRHRWRHRPHRRVPRVGHPRPLDGRTHDRVQHVDRSGRQGRADRRATTRRSPTCTAATHAPTDEAWEAAVADWRSLATDEDATFDKEVALDAAEIRPHVSWGTNPGQVVSIDARVPSPDSFARRDRRGRRPSARSSTWDSMPARPSVTSASTPCSSARARTAASRTCEPRPTSCAAVTSRRGCGRSWFRAHGRSSTKPKPRDCTTCSPPLVSTGAIPGCSMCLAMNPDKLAPGERCASTSNRNFEGRQGRGGRTHPRVAAARRRRRHPRSPVHFAERPASTNIRRRGG